MEYQELSNLVTTRINDLRAILLVLNNQKFERLWTTLTSTQQDKVLDSVNLFHRDYIKGLLKDVVDYGEMTSSQLKKHAARRGISNYSRMTKSMLVSLLEENYEKGRDVRGD